MAMGDLSRFLVEYGMGRKITCDEAIEILRKCEGDGLVHTIYPDHAICNCCRDCCPYFISLHELGVRTLQPSNYLPQVVMMTNAMRAAPVGIAAQLEQ